jgi:hypothetical protein
MTPPVQQVSKSRRVARERKTVTAMMRIYCRGQHRTRGELCDACTQLHAYAMCRLDRCPFGVEKPTCANCPVHCYKADRREEIRAVMRYAGPRMLWRHPFLAVLHLLDGRRVVKELASRCAPNAPPPDQRP